MRIYSWVISLKGFAKAEAMLSWGLDLNEDCPSSSYQDHYTPMQKLLFSYLSDPKSSPIEQERLNLIKNMLNFGANPNQVGITFQKPIVISALLDDDDLDFVQLLFNFGADPNVLDDDGMSIFAYAASVFGSFRMQANSFAMFYNAGGDVNLAAKLSYSPAQVIVSKEENTETVEALIQTGKVDWCKSLDPIWRKRTIDLVRPEYQQLLSKYRIACPRFKTLFGNGKSCVAAQEDGIRQCSTLGFKKAIFDPYPSESGCLVYGDSASVNSFAAMVHCTD